jgi:hypothetical protein
MWFNPETSVFAIWKGTGWVGLVLSPIIIVPPPGDGTFLFLGEPLYFSGESLTTATI